MSSNPFKYTDYGIYGGGDYLSGRPGLYAAKWQHRAKFVCAGLPAAV